MEISYIPCRDIFCLYQRMIKMLLAVLYSCIHAIIILSHCNVRYEHTFFPVVNSSGRNDMEKAASSDTQLTGVVTAWQLKALLAGRTPLPSSRPKRKMEEMESPESSVYPDSCTWEEDCESAKCVDDSRNEDDKQNTTITHVVSVIDVDVSTATGWTLTSHRPRNQN